MRQLFRYGFVVGTVLALAAVQSFGQLVVDARGPNRERKWGIDGGQGGGTGRKIPLGIVVRVLGSTRSAGTGESDVTFVLTNQGKDPVVLPTSPHPGDFEPNDPNTGFEVETLALGISLRADPRTGVIATILNGSAERPGTLVALAPGESIEVIASMKIPAPSAANNTGPFSASAILSHEVIKTNRGKRFSDLEERGSAWFETVRSRTAWIRLTKALPSKAEWPEHYGRVHRFGDFDGIWFRTRRPDGDQGRFFRS